MERTREWILFTLEIGVTVITGYLAIRAVLGPDMTRTLRARSAKDIEHFCQRQAETWAHMADKAARAYERTRNVNA